MSDKDFVDQLRENNAYKDAPKKRWGTYNTAEIEAYISNLNKKIKHTEKVFQEQNEDLKQSLQAVTRERDALLKQSDREMMEEIADHQLADLERLLMKRGMLVIPQKVYEMLQQENDENKEKAKQVEGALREIQEKHQAFINAHHELLHAFNEFAQNRPLEPREPEPNTGESGQDCLEIIKGQHEMLGKLKECLADALTQLKDFSVNEPE